MSARKDLKNKVFGDFTVIDFAFVSKTHAYWNVKCNACGTLAIRSGSNLEFYTAMCVSFMLEERWTIKKDDRLSLCSDYLSGMKGNDIMEKYNIKRPTIYKVLKSHGIKADRKK